jgi:hypothetical protein
MEERCPPSLQTLLGLTASALFSVEKKKQINAQGHVIVIPERQG